ncbi:MAG TPA: TolC family protein [Spirochaetia bacterium]|nr:TolC family protein [Spirochaetia bacterium]
MKYRIHFLLVALLATGALSRAAAVDTLSLEQARTLALSQSQTLQEALASVSAAKLDEKLQSYTLLPSITVSASGSAAAQSSSSSATYDASAGVAIKQTIFDSTYGVLAAISRISTSIAQTSARTEYFNVIAAADTAFYNAAKALASVAASSSDLDSAKASEELAKAKLEAGMISPVDFMKQEATVASNEAAFVSAQGSSSAAMRALASLTGIKLPVTLAPVDNDSSASLMKRVAILTDGQAATFIARLEATAAGNNLSLQQASLAVEKAQKNVDLAYAGYLPAVSASLSGSTNISGVLQGSAVLSVSMPLDLWNTSTTVASKKVAAQQAALALSEAQRTTGVSIEQAVFDIISSARSVAASQKALEYAQSYFENIQEQYRLSTASAADLTDAAQLVSTDRASRISAQYQFLAGLSTLRSLAGLEADDLLVKLLP